MPRVGIVANDEDYALWLEGDVYRTLMDVPADDGETTLVQIRPGQALTGLGFTLILVLTWPEDDTDDAGGMRWLHEEVAVRLEEGGLLMIESVDVNGHVRELPEPPLPEQDSPA